LGTEFVLVFSRNEIINNDVYIDDSKTKKRNKEDKRNNRTFFYHTLVIYSQLPL